MVDYSKILDTVTETEVPKRSYVSTRTYAPHPLLPTVQTMAEKFRADGKPTTAMQIVVPEDEHKAVVQAIRGLGTKVEGDPVGIRVQISEPNKGKVAIRFWVAQRRQAKAKETTAEAVVTN